MEKKPLWSGRFRKGLHPLAKSFSSSIAADARLYAEDIAGSISHISMLASTSVVSKEECYTITTALDQIKKEIESGILQFDAQEEDVHLAIERLLIERVGDVGGKLHTARSRNDQIALDERLYLKKRIPQLQLAIRELQRALLDQAESHQQTIMPGYTHLQRAQPVLLAHHLLAYVSMLDRDHQRFADCLTRADNSPLGAAAFAGTSYPIDRIHAANLLGFSGVMVNSIDAVSARDHLIECIADCSILAMHLSRMAEELVFWSTTEFGFVEMDDEVSTGSSIMPQKKNPDMAELVRGKTGKVYGALVALLTTMKALPLAYNRDMQEDKEPLFAALDTVFDCTAIMTLIIEHSRFQCERMEDACKNDLLLATEIADYLTRKGMPFRTAHHMTGQLIAYAENHKKELSALDLDELIGFSPLFAPDVFQVLSSKASIMSKRSLGSTSYDSVKEQIGYWKNTLNN